jgi:hypothetical protein
LAELVAAFSLATDLGLGQPMERVLRSWAIAARLGDHMGVERDDRGALFHVATLRGWVAWRTIPARLGARRPAAQVLQAELA